MKQIIFNEETQLIEEIKDYKIVLFIGNGSKNQYNKEDLNKIDIKLNNLIKKFNKNWIAVYGGDKYDDENPDIGYIMKKIHEKGIKTCAIQSDIVLKWNSPIEQYIDLVYYVKTSYKDNNDILWGGFHNGELIGPSKIYLENFIEKGILNEIIVIGGGLITKDEIIYAINKGFNPKYIKVKVGKKIDNKDEYIQNYGFIEELLKNDKYKEKIIQI